MSKTAQTTLPIGNTVECHVCGGEYDRDITLKLGPSGWLEDDTDEDEFVCVRCASLAFKGGPE